MATSTINAVDLINFSQGIAQLNLGYLGISVAVLGVLGGVFIYFNIKPLKDSLDKQEKAISDLKKEAYDLLNSSRDQSEKTLEFFKTNQAESLDLALQQYKENIGLETTNKIQELESAFSGKIEAVSESKDIKLKEIILSEVANRSATLEKSLTAALVSSKGESEKNLAQTNQIVTSLKSSIKDLQRDTKELKVYKYSKENQMGAVIYSIELLKDDIDEKRWSILASLERVSKEITEIKLDPGYISQIEEQLARIEKEPKYTVIISQIRSKYSDKRES